jgi:hypothetical protein
VDTGQQGADGNMTSEDGHEEPFGAEVVRQGVKRRFENAKNSYNQVLNRLWAGNSAGVLTAIGTLGSGRVSNTRLLLLALFLFLVGVFALGIGSFASLVAELRSLRDWEEADSILDLKVTASRRPSVEAGLAVNFQTITSICAAVAFISGTICGLILAFKGFY